MNSRMQVGGLVAVLALTLAADGLACGDKFLVAGRGTRYQRPRTARAASVVIYANPASGLPQSVGKVSLESVLRREGHRSTAVETFDQLSSVLQGGRFDVVVAASSVVDSIRGLLGSAPGVPVIVSLCTRPGEKPARPADSGCLQAPPREGALLQAIDKAVEQHDHGVRRAGTIG